MFEPLLQAPAHIQVHAFAAMVAMLLGPFALFRTRRDRLHKTLGYIWVLAMVAVISSSFFIFGMRLIGPFSPIHILSLMASWGLFSGLRAAIKGDINRHRETMRALYFWALGIAGMFTLLPGRIMSQVVFGKYQTQGFLTVFTLVILLIILARFRAYQARKTVQMQPGE